MQLGLDIVTFKLFISPDSISSIRFLEVHFAQKKNPKIIQADLKKIIQTLVRGDLIEPNPNTGV